MVVSGRKDFISGTELIPDGQIGANVQVSVRKRLSPALERVRERHALDVDRRPVALGDDLVGDAGG